MKKEKTSSMIILCKKERYDGLDHKQPEKSFVTVSFLTLYELKLMTCSFSKRSLPVTKFLR